VFSVSSVAAAFRFIVILLPDPAYITEYIEDPFDTVRIVGDSNLTARKINNENYSRIICMINDICIIINMTIYAYSFLYIQKLVIKLVSKKRHFYIPGMLWDIVSVVWMLFPCV